MTVGIWSLVPDVHICGISHLIVACCSLYSVYLIDAIWILLLLLLLLLLLFTGGVNLELLLYAAKMKLSYWFILKKFLAKYSGWLEHETASNGNGDKEEHISVSMATQVGLCPVLNDVIH